MLPVINFKPMPTRREIRVPAAAEGESKLVSIAKDWLAGGVSAGISKTVVAPIGES